MKIGREFQIENAMSKDITRPHMCHANYEPEKRRLVATDGHMLAVVPAFPGDGETAGPVSADAIKAARKAAGRRGDPSIHANGALAVEGGPSFPRPTVGAFPPVDNVIPTYRPNAAGSVTIALDAGLLLALAKAIGTDGKVKITFPAAKPDASILEPLYVEPLDGSCNGAFGVLMPCRR